jgi:hypothetical protein
VGIEDRDGYRTIVFSMDYCRSIGRSKPLLVQFRYKKIVAYTTTILLSDRLLQITCHSQVHAEQIAASLDALDARVRPATQAEVEMMEFAGVVPGGTLVDRLRIDDYFAKLEGVCQ